MKSGIKIGVVRRGYSRTGGAEAYLRRFAEEAAAAGHTIVLFTESWPRDEWPWEHVRLHSRSPQEFAGSLRARRAGEACDFLLSLERVWSCDAYRAGDGVHAAWLERRARYEPFWKPWFRRFDRKHRETLELERALFGPDGAKQVIANSRMVKAHIERHFSYPAENIYVVYNGVPPHVLARGAREEFRRELELAENEYAILFAGSGWERKGLRYAIEAVNAMPLGTRLLVAGRGSTRGLPASRRVNFLGPISEMARCFAAADAFVLPTLYEPFSNACLEALNAGLPVITTRHNGFAEIIKPGEEGEVVTSPRDTPALVRALEGWRDPARRARMRAQLQALGARFSLAENARQTLEIIARGIGAPTA